MKSSNHKITLKVLFGYIALALLATVSVWLVFSELKTFTDVQNAGIKDQSKILKTGSLIADIYENESLARAAIQIDSPEKFNAYISENESLMSRIDSLNILINSQRQEKLLDSIKEIFSKKLDNITDLKRIKQSNTSDKSITQAIRKLSSVYSILGKLTVEDFIEDPLTLDSRTRRNLEDYVSLLNKHAPNDTISRVNQKEIDSIVTVSRNMLENVQKETLLQRQNSQKKEHELLKNDSITSKQLRNLLAMLEIEINAYSKSMNAKHEQTLNKSKNIVFTAAAISFIIIIIFSIIILNDFWKSQRYRQQLENANNYTNSLLKSREQLISMVSHDLRTPLSTITGYSELLQKSSQNSKDGYYINHIKNASTYMTQLVEDLLDFSKLEDGNITTENVTFSLQTIINEVAANFKTIYAHKPIELIVHHDNALSKPLTGDPLRIKQILYNLVGNAYKFTNQGNITITTQLVNAPKPYVKIAVKDTGIGIDKTQQENIFKAFTQAHDKTINAGGFGLGLTISKQLVELLGGSLTLKSKPDKGSMFFLRLPVVFSEIELKAPTKTSYNLKAIVVDDDASIRQLISELLTQYNIKVKPFDNAKNALQHIENIDFDFVITDIQLPKMNGFHFMETLKASKYYKQQPIIAMTGRTDMRRDDYLESGFSEIIFKPFTHVDLHNVLTVFFPNQELNVPVTENNISLENHEIFNCNALSSFLNHDDAAVKSTLQAFATDTKTNISDLKTAVNTNDVEAINNISHKMLSMFKLLSVYKAVPHLETLAHHNTFPETTFTNLEVEVQQLLEAIDDYLS